MSGRSRLRLLIWSFIAALAFIFVSLFVGPAKLHVGEVLGALCGRGELSNQIIVRNVRLPRALLAMIVGSGLAAAGVMFQGLFRNPLADPFVIGVSGGAALGAVLAIVIGLPLTFLGLGGVALSAFFGGVLTTALVVRIARFHGRTPITTLLLAGFAIGSFASALVSVLMMMHAQSWNEIMGWLLGHLDRPDSWLRLRICVILMLPAMIVGGFYGRDLNVLTLGEDSAYQLGVNVEHSKRILLILGTLLSATAVAMCGVIGFVGLIIPHMVRLVTGPDHRKLFPIATVFGGVFLVFADMLSRILYPPSGLPVGTVTALLGAPFFLFLMRKMGGR